MYTNQYRAMFVLNCKIMKDEVLKYRPKQRTKGKRKKSDKEVGIIAAAAEDPEVYRPVRCNTCNTEVAVYDSDEIFHFFNVLAGAP